MNINISITWRDVVIALGFIILGYAIGWFVGVVQVGSKCAAWNP